jgi:hypothetical protein
LPEKLLAKLKHSPCIGGIASNLGGIALFGCRLLYFDGITKHLEAHQRLLLGVRYFNNGQGSLSFLAHTSNWSEVMGIKGDQGVEGIDEGQLVEVIEIAGASERRGGSGFLINYLM